MSSTVAHIYHGKDKSIAQTAQTMELPGWGWDDDHQLIYIEKVQDENNFRCRLAGSAASVLRPKKHIRELREGDPSPPSSAKIATGNKENQNYSTPKRKAAKVVKISTVSTEGSPDETPDMFATPATDTSSLTATPATDTSSSQDSPNAVTDSDDSTVKDSQDSITVVPSSGQEEDESNDEARKSYKTKVGPPKVQIASPTLYTHADLVEGMSPPSVRRPLRSSKALRLARWQYVVRHEGLCTFAGIDQNRTRVVAPGLDWLVDAARMTVLTPYQVSGGPMRVALVRSERMQTADGVPVPSIQPDDAVSILVTDLFANCCPAEVTKLPQYHRAVAAAEQFVTDFGDKLIPWSNLTEFRSAALMLGEERESKQLQAKLRAVSKVKKPPVVKRARAAADEKKVMLRLKRRRSIAAKKAAATRKRKREEQKQVVDKQRKVAKEAAEAALASIKKEVRDVVNTLQPDVDAIKTQVSDVFDKKLRDTSKMFKKQDKILQQCCDDVQKLRSELEQTKAQVQDSVEFAQSTPEERFTLASRTPTPRPRPTGSFRRFRPPLSRQPLPGANTPFYHDDPFFNRRVAQKFARLLFDETGVFYP